MPDQQDRRRWPRLPLAADIEFRRRKQTHYTIGLHDLTPQGCRIAAPEKLAAGELVFVQLPTLASMLAQVRWTEASQSGVEFDRPMHPAVFDMMAARLAPAND